MASPLSQSLLFVIVGRNEPLFEMEIHKRGTNPNSTSDAMTRQNYFVLHSSLDLVDKAAWNSSNMYLKVVDKVCKIIYGFTCIEGIGKRPLNLYTKCCFPEKFP
jgi:hypothetical protein